MPYETRQRISQRTAVVTALLVEALRMRFIFGPALNSPCAEISIMHCRILWAVWFGRCSSRIGIGAPVDGLLPDPDEVDRIPNILLRSK